MIPSFKPSPSEAVIIGSLLSEADPEFAYNAIATNKIESTLFADEYNKTIFSIISADLEQGFPVDVAGLYSRHAVAIGESGGVSRLLNMVELADTSNIGSHAIQAMNRRDEIALTLDIVKTLDGLTAQADTPYVTATELVRTLNAYSDHSRPDELTVLDRIEDSWLDEMAGNKAVSIVTGVSELDRCAELNGLSAEGITLVLAASGAGKTTFTTRLTLGLLGEGKSVYLHSSEVSVPNRLQALCMAAGRVDRREWRKLALQASKYKAMGNAEALAQITAKGDKLRALAQDGADWVRGHIEGGNLSLTGSGLTIEQITLHARNLHQQERLDVGIVDYIQDVTNSRQKGVGTNDREQTGHKSNTIKELSYGLRVPFVMCAQVSGEKTAQPQDDLRPKMFSAQHSSTLHQDADTVLALYRADYYVAQFGPQWKDNGQPPESETLEVIVRKNRNGGLTTVKMDTDFSTGWLGRPMSLYR